MLGYLSMEDFVFIMSNAESLEQPAANQLLCLFFERNKKSPSIFKGLSFGVLSLLISTPFIF